MKDMKKAILLVSALMLFTFNARSNEPSGHLSLGLEAGTTGAGIQIAVPIIKNHLVITAGYNYAKGSFALSHDGLNMGGISGSINDYINDGNSYLSKVPGESRRLSPMPNSTSVDVDADIDLGGFKAMLEFYPSKNSGFHINAGVFAGSEGILDANGSVPDYWKAYSSMVNDAKTIAKDYPDYSSVVGSIPELSATVGDRTLALKDDGIVNLGLKTAAIRPYLGLGFGRSIPRKHFGFQFDLGVLYTGKYDITSANEVEGTSGYKVENEKITQVLELADKICIYPQMSLRLIYKIF